MSNQLSLRSLVRGRRLADRVEVRGSLRELRAPRLTLLVHGWNNSVRQASESFEAFAALLREGGGSSQALGALWELHWPSDHPSGMLTLGTYPIRVADAQSAGRLLADFLADELSPWQEVRLVGHSLGCRVALETVRWVRADASYAGARIGKVVLLAAAVPQVFCSDANYPFAAPSLGRQHVFWSRRDRALGLKFDAGQRLYGEPGQAVGRNGLPPGRWNSTTHTGLGHSDYWRSGDVARQVATQLRGSVMTTAPAQRSLPAGGAEARRPERRRLLPRGLRRR